MLFKLFVLKCERRVEIIQLSTQIKWNRALRAEMDPNESVNSRNEWII